MVELADTPDLGSGVFGREGSSPSLGTMKKKVCVVSIMRNEKYFLPIWLNYYSKHIPKEDIYIIAHNNTDNSLDNIDVNIIEFKTDHFTTQLQNDKYTEVRKELHKKYEWVLFADADEIVLPDSNLFPRGLPQYIKHIEDNDIATVRCHGYQIIHDMEYEPDLDVSRPVLFQRSLWMPDRLYQKASLSSVFVNLDLGYHTCLDGSFLDRRLYLLHLHYADYRIKCERLKQWKTANRKDNNVTGAQNKIDEKEVEDKIKNLASRRKTERIPNHLNGV